MLKSYIVDKKTFILLLVVLVDLIGFGIVIPVLPLMVEKLGGNALLVGIVISAFSLFQFLFAPILGRLSDKYGRRPLLIITSLVNSLSYLAIMLYPKLIVILLARMVAGIGSANIPVAQAYIADISKAHERTKKLALIGSAFGLGFIIGPLIGGIVADKFSTASTFLVPFALSFANAILIYIFLPESNKIPQKHIKIHFLNLKVTREVFKPKNMAFLLTLFFFVNFALALIIGVFSLLGQSRFGWTEAQNGYYFGLIGIGSFLTQAFIIRILLKKFDEVRLIKIGLLTFTIVIIAVGLSPFAPLTYLLGPITAFGVSIIMVNTPALISLESKPEEQGIVMGVAQSLAAIGRVFGPLVGGAIGTLNLSLPFILSGFVTIFVFFAGRNYLKFIRDSAQSRKMT